MCSKIGNGHLPRGYSFGVDSLCQTMAALLRHVHPGLDEIARQLRLSPRNLQRRLFEHGLSHSELADQVRREHACRWLRRERTAISDIAGHLGYA